MAKKKSMEEEVIVEGELSDVFKSISNSLDRKIYKNLNTNNDLYEITANYKNGSIKGEIFVSFTSESEKTTKIKIKTTASDSISSFMSSCEVITQMFKENIKNINNQITFNNNYSKQDLILIIKHTKQDFDLKQPVKIYIDNNKKYKIEIEDSIEIPISYGIHTIKFSYDTQDKVIDINITQNTVLNINFNQITGDIEINSENKKGPYNTLCVVGAVISGISLLLNLWGIVGIVGTSLSVAGLLDCQKKNENGKTLAIAGIVIGAYSILYAAYLFYTIGKQFNTL